MVRYVSYEVKILGIKTVNFKEIIPLAWPLATALYKENSLEIYNERQFSLELFCEKSVSVWEIFDY